MTPGPRPFQSSKIMAEQIEAPLATEIFDSLAGEHIREKTPEEKSEEARQKREAAKQDKKLAEGESSEAATIAAGALADEIAQKFDFDEAFSAAPDEKTHEGEPPPGPSAGAAPQRDSKGESFDPSRHKADEHGDPLKNEDGTFKKKWRKRSAEDEDEYDAFAEIACEATYNLTGLLLDPNEAMPAPSRHEKLKAAWSNYARIKKLSIADPFYALLAANALYVQDTVKQPKSREIAMTWGQKAVSTVKGWFGKKAA
jgi:hypothetical protein